MCSSRCLDSKVSGVPLKVCFSLHQRECTFLRGPSAGLRLRYSQTFLAIMTGQNPHTDIQNHHWRSPSDNEFEDRCKLATSQDDGLTMPDDKMPLSFAGFRFASTSTRLFSISSSGTNATRPDTICRNAPCFIDLNYLECLRLKIQSDRGHSLLEEKSSCRPITLT